MSKKYIRLIAEPFFLYQVNFPPTKGRSTRSLLSISSLNSLISPIDNQTSTFPLLHPFDRVEITTITQFSNNKLLLTLQQLLSK